MIGTPVLFMFIVLQSMWRSAAAQSNEQTVKVLLAATHVSVSIWETRQDRLGNLSRDLVCVGQDNWEMDLNEKRCAFLEVFIQPFK